MDRLNSGFDGDDSNPAASDVGIEAPPMIGQDERRMHVRAYNFWAKLLDGRSFPSIEMLDVEDLGDFGPHSVLLDFTSGIENPAISFLGAALARECELDDSIQYIADVPRKSLLSRLTDHYLQIIANRAPIGFEAEFVNSHGATILYRGVLMPFSSDDDTIDFILGVINWKQAADIGLTAAIAEEMAATAVAPPPPTRPTLPVWSDGPDSAHDEDFADLLGDDDGDAMPRGLSLDRPAAAVATPDAFVADASDDDDILELGAEFVAGASTEPLGLADRLAAARAVADLAAQANARGHAALYQAIGRAWDFACAAANAPDDYAELLEEAGIAVSPRAPLTPVVKLVFGAGHDKTRVAEYTAVLGHAAQTGIASGELADYLAGYSGGLKALVRDVRAAARAAAPPVDRDAAIAEKLAVAPPLAILPDAGFDCDGDYLVLLARRDGNGDLAIIGHLGAEDASTVRVMRSVARR